MERCGRRKASQVEDGVDLISDIPDAILLLILSLLSSTEEAIRTSILSRRWRYLWTALPSLDISYPDMRYGERFTTNEFKEFVHWILVNKSVDLDSFALSCHHHFSMSEVGRWIDAAVARNIKQLNLSFCPKEKTEAIELPDCLVTCGSLEVLKLNLNTRGLILPKVKGFPALRFLNLTDVELLEDDDLVKGFLESCPLLEDLSLLDCVIYKLDLLCISCPKLKRLSIIDWDNVGCHRIKICCPKLVDLDLTGYITCNLFFEGLDSLKKAVIEPKMLGDTISVLFPGISGVEYLSTDLYFFSECINAALNPALPNLKNLVLKTTMYDFTMDDFNRILKYNPKLESLKLIIEEDFDGKYECLDEAETRRILTPDVKSVEVFEFNGEKSKVDIYWFEDELEMEFSWGNESRFSRC